MICGCSFLNFKLILAKIGIVLIACNIPFFIPIPPFPFIQWVLHACMHVFHGFPCVAIVYSLFPLTLAAGFVLYITGRKEFSDHVKGSETASWLLMFFGLILMAASLAFLLRMSSFLSSEWARPETSIGWAPYVSLFAWSGFGSISGVLWLVDGFKMGEDRAIPLRKEIDFEEALEKYPKDLLAKYVKRYPHNPKGVLEWHIYEIMKEGKTREQAIKELAGESE